MVPNGAESWTLQASSTGETSGAMRKIMLPPQHSKSKPHQNWKESPFLLQNLPSGLLTRPVLLPAGKAGRFYKEQLYHQRAGQKIYS